MKVLAKSRLLTRLYYFVVSSAFAREQQAALAGRVQYQEQDIHARQNLFLLRRNTHRLEKGLLMRPRRPFFALDYIEDTVETYAYVVENVEPDQTDQGNLKWSHDVLEEYFSIVEEHPQLAGPRQRFASFSNSFIDDKRYVPYKRQLAVPLSVSYDELLNLAQRRRSVRWYRQEPVPRDLIDKAIEIASLSPSACNRQPYQFLVIDHPEQVSAVAQLPKGTNGFYQNFPAIVAIVGQLSAYFSERDRHVIYIDGSLAAMSFMLALETLGLSSCPINWPDIESLEKKAGKLLKLADDQRIIMFISVGFPNPDGLVAYSQKKQLSDIRRYDLP